MSEKMVRWPYPLEWDKTETVETDILVLGGGAAGCFAALGAAAKGASVALVEKGAAASSGAGGSGCDHWESAASNPCSRVSPEDLAETMIRAFSGYNNGISHYIECREGYDRLLDLEKMGGKVRDTDDEFKGADFRDEKSKLLFAYDYFNRTTIRVWGTTFKPAMARGCRRAGVHVFDRVMAAGLLTANGKPGARIAGAVGVHARTGKFIVFKAKAVVICTSRPTRLWLFSPELPGISEFRPFPCSGDGHAMAWRAGAEFTMMEKSVKGEWSGLRSFPPYSTGNNHNTWYACNLVDADGRELPWVDRDGKILENFADRFRPSPGQRLYLKGGNEPNGAVYEVQGPDTLSVDELLKRGYRLPFFADLTSLPEMERKIIWGMMVGQEGKTKIPVLRAYNEGGFDPSRDLLQSYGDGWKSGAFLPQERQLFGLPGGLLNDWNLMTNVEGLFAAGDALFASDCFGHAAATGHYAGRHAAAFAAQGEAGVIDEKQVKKERRRAFAPVKNGNGPDWRELNTAVTRIMQNYCGAFKSEALLETGLRMLADLRDREATQMIARNPHELVRALEVMSIMTNAELVMESCRARKARSRELEFARLDYPEMDPPEWTRFVTVKRSRDGVETGSRNLDYYGSLTGQYEKHNLEYRRTEDER
jgi:succinate dehydrogenase/fumarate reductase flavoprotein subunit